jgi:hypothetical protein
MGDLCLDIGTLRFDFEWRMYVRTDEP